jgi:DNA-directed RNA polymerase specialized sigma24 family protein
VKGVEVLVAEQTPSVETFTTFARDVEPKLRYALVAACGPSRGLDATQDALVFAWEHWEKVTNSENPAGLLYRVATRRAWRRRQQPPPLVQLPPKAPHRFEPGLEPALEHLSKQQRTVVVLIEGFRYTHQEVADLLGIKRSTVQKHRERGLEKLRRELRVSLDA